MVRNPKIFLFDIDELGLKDAALKDPIIEKKVREYLIEFGYINTNEKNYKVSVLESINKSNELIVIVFFSDSLL